MKSSVMRLILIINQELTWAQGTMNNKWKALSVPFLRKDLLYCNSAFYIALLSLRNMIIQAGLIFISEPREDNWSVLSDLDSKSMHFQCIHGFF